MLVDTKLAGWGQRIMDQVRSVTDKPVTTIINTHTHGDHTGSNEFFPASVEVVAQENTKANMEKMDAFKGDKAQFLPDKTYKDKLTLILGRRSDRPLLLRRRPHQRRQHRRLPGAARRARRRPVRAQGHAAHRRQQRRQRRRVSGNPEEGGVQASRAWTASSPATATCSRGARWPNMASSTGVPGRDEGRHRGRQERRGRRRRQFKMPDKFKDYNMNGVKDNVTKIYAELKK